MPISRQELWMNVPKPVMYVVTTNAFVKTNGELVMGRGAAYQATKRIPFIAKRCAESIDHGMVYGFQVVYPAGVHQPGFGIFQVKRYWMDDASLMLIKKSAGMLERYARMSPGLKIRLNFPGIGNGKLSRSDVEPLLTDLAKVVTICYR